MTDVQCHVYFVRPVGADGPIKIGCTIDPARRLAEITAWSPMPLEIVATVPGTFQTEAALHALFEDSRSHGEWFRLTPELSDLLTRLVAGQGLDLSAIKVRPSRDTPLRGAIRVYGSSQRLAAKLNITPQALSQWRRVPPLRVLEVERLTGVPRHELRPDLYPGAAA